MSKLLVAIVASLATLVATSGGAQAAFLVSVTIDGNAQTLTPTSTGSVNSGSYALNQTFLTTSVAGEGVNVTIASTATEGGGVSRLNTSNISVFNGGPSTRSVVVRIEQTGYQFGGFGAFTSPVTIGASNPGGVATLTSLAQNVGTYTNSPTQFGFGQSFANSGQQGAAANPSSFVQTLTLTNFATNSFINVVDNSAFTVITPLPATGLMAAVGFPLLGLAGAFRRRVLG